MKFELAAQSTPTVMARTNGILASPTNFMFTNIHAGAFIQKTNLGTNGLWLALNVSITNGLATTNYVNTATNGLVTASVTNGLATTNFVIDATNGLVTSVVTNGLATTNYVNDWDAASSNVLRTLIDTKNPKISVWSNASEIISLGSWTNIDFYGWSGALTQANGKLSVGLPIAVTNGLSTTNYVNDATNTLSGNLTTAINNSTSAVSRVIFVQQGNSSLTNITTTETSWIGTAAQGSTTLPDSFWTVGRSLEILAHGKVWSQAGSPINVTRVKLGSQVVATNWPGTLPPSLTGDIWSLRLTLTCDTNSASIGYISCYGEFRMLSASGGTLTHSKQFNSTEPIFDTTASVAFDIVSTNNPSTISIQTKQFLIKQLN